MSRVTSCGIAAATTSRMGQLMTLSCRRSSVTCCNTLQSGKWFKLHPVMCNCLSSLQPFSPAQHGTTQITLTGLRIRVHHSFARHYRISAYLQAPCHPFPWNSSLHNRRSAACSSSSGGTSTDWHACSKLVTIMAHASGTPCQRLCSGPCKRAWCTCSGGARQ